MPPFTFVRNLWAKNAGRAPHPPLRESSENNIEVEAPESLTANQAQAYFYQAMFDLDTSTASWQSLNNLNLPQKLVIDVTRTALSERNQRVKCVPRLPTIIPKLLRSLRDPDAGLKSISASLTQTILGLYVLSK